MANLKEAVEINRANSMVKENLEVIANLRNREQRKQAARKRTFIYKRDGFIDPPVRAFVRRVQPTLQTLNELAVISASPTTVMACLSNVPTPLKSPVDSV